MESGSGEVCLSESTFFLHRQPLKMLVSCANMIHVRHDSVKILRHKKVVARYIVACREVGKRARTESSRTRGNFRLFCVKHDSRKLLSSCKLKQRQERRARRQRKKCLIAGMRAGVGLSPLSYYARYPSGLHRLAVLVALVRG